MIVVATAVAQPVSKSLQDPDIAKLIAQLGDPSFEKRTQATRNLIIAGPPRSIDALRRAAKGDDYEVAIRARHLLVLFEELCFPGVNVTLHGPSKPLNWSDSFDLILKLENTTSSSARVPMDLQTSQSAAVPRWWQPIHLLDVADFLVVTDPDGKTMSLRVDDIDEDDQLRRLVELRTEQSPSSRISPFESISYSLSSFNRGQARYRMLREGTYRVRFVYEPQWSDEELQKAAAGKVVSSEITVIIEEGAPPEIRNATAPLSLTLESVGNQFIAKLTNTYDRDKLVNLNVHAESGPPFARIRWWVLCGGERTELTNEPLSIPDAQPFTRNRLTSLKPGQSVELTQWNPAKWVNTNKEFSGSECQIFVTYSNVTSLSWQQNAATNMIGNQNAPKALQTPLPPGICVTTLTSNELKIPSSE